MIVSIKNALVLGIRSVIKNVKFMFLLWGVNALAALLLSLPIYYLLMENLNHSLLSDQLALGFDFTWYLQFRNIYSTNIGEIPFMIYGTVGVYIIVQIFFIGGLISIFNHPEKNHTVDFFFGGVKYWFRFTKIVLISLFFFMAVFILHDYLGFFIEWSFSNTENQMADFLIRLARYILLVFIIGLVTIVSDYTKVFMAVQDTTRTVYSISQSILFIKRNFNKVFSVFLIVAIIGAAGAILYNLLEAFIPRTPYYFLLLSFILQQMLIIFRLFIRMYFCATEVLLYKDLSAELVELKAKEQNVGAN